MTNWLHGPLNHSLFVACVFTAGILNDILRITRMFPAELEIEFQNVHTRFT